MENKIKTKNKKPALTEKLKRILGKSKGNKIIPTLFTNLQSSINAIILISPLCLGQIRGSTS